MAEATLSAKFLQAEKDEINERFRLRQETELFKALDYIQSADGKWEKLDPSKGVTVEEYKHFEAWISELAHLHDATHESTPTENAASGVDSYLKGLIRGLALDRDGVAHT